MWQRRMLKKAALDDFLLPTETSHETTFADESVLQVIAENIDESNARFEPKDTSPWRTQSLRKGTHGARGSPHQQQPQLRHHQSVPEPFKSVIVHSNGSDNERYFWLYKDDQGHVRGPYPEDKMASWFASGDLKMSLNVKRACDRTFQTLGQVIKNWGCFPFKCQEQTTRSSEPVANGSRWLAQMPFTKPIQQPRLSQQLSRKTSASQGSGSHPALLCSPEFSCEASFKTVLKPLPPPKERNKRYGDRQVQRGAPAAMLRSAFQRIPAQKPTYLFLGVRDGPEEPEYSKTCEEAASVKPRFSREGAWGGYETTSSQRRTIPQLKAAPRPTRPPPNSQPSTWADVCQQSPVEHVKSLEEVEQPIVIENMASFPSLGGKAFSASLQQNSLRKKSSAADEEFMRWAYESLWALPSYVHVPTLFELLRNVDSNEKIQEYVKMHLGEDDDVRRFSLEFIRRRSRWKEQTGGKSPATSFDSGMGNAGSIN